VNPEPAVIAVVGNELRRVAAAAWGEDVVDGKALLVTGTRWMPPGCLDLGRVGASDDTHSTLRAVCFL
jgi:hypothetical protein